MNQDIRGTGIRGGLPNFEYSKQDCTNQFYWEYSYKNLTIDAEYRRYLRDEIIRSGVSEDEGDFRSWYVAGSYRFTKWLQVGSFYSNLRLTSTFLKILNSDTPAGHGYNKVITGRFDINRFWNIKIEGHFMDGYGAGPFPNGFYPQQNPVFAPSTKALVLMTNFNF